MKGKLSWLARRRDGFALGMAVGIAALGWGGTLASWPPLIVVHEPGFELALLLKVTQQRGHIGYLAVSETTVFALNVLVWTAVFLVGGGISKAIKKAWSRSWLTCAFLVSTAISAVSELTNYDNYWLPWLPTLSRPGWSIAPTLAPITSFLIDLRTPLTLFSYPDRLITTTLALAINIGIWTVVIFVGFHAANWIGRRSAGHVAA